MAEERNRDVCLNLGLIAWGPLREIEKLQRLLEADCKGLKVIYQTVTARKLWLSKRNLDGGDRGRETGEDGQETRRIR